jgi:hypothetical protein
VQSIKFQLFNLRISAVPKKIQLIKTEKGDEEKETVKKRPRLINGVHTSVKVHNG